jgi:hypothetical protein
LLLVAFVASVSAQRVLCHFSGGVRSIDDPLGVLTASNYYRTGDTVSASFILDRSAYPVEIYNDGTFRRIPLFGGGSKLGIPFYCRLVSGPLMPDFHSEAATRSDATRHFLYGAHETIRDRESFESSTSLTGGSSASSFRIIFPIRSSLPLRVWPDDFIGVTVVGIATAATDTISIPTAVMDMRLDSIVRITNHYAPEPVLSVPQAIHIPGLLESTDDTFFILGGRTFPKKVRLNASPLTDGDSDPLHYAWSEWDSRLPPSLNLVAQGEKSIITFYAPAMRLFRFGASDGSLEVLREVSITVYTPAQATKLMREVVRGLSGSFREKTTAAILLQNATVSFTRAEWKRGLQFLEMFEQMMARSAFTIPQSKRTSFVELSQAIRHAINRPL